MILRQLFDHESYTYTYLIADTATAKAALIDPVDTKTDDYIKLLAELNLTLVDEFIGYLFLMVCIYFLIQPLGICQDK